jgi:DNA-binding LacI/PurR family transcriptional regulator
VVVHNEPVVEPLLAAFRDAGRAVPDDLSVVAICPDELAERTTPALTSVAIMADEVGRQAVSLVMAKLSGDHVPEATLLRPRLTERASSAAPRADQGRDQGRGKGRGQGRDQGRGHSHDLSPSTR